MQYRQRRPPPKKPKQIGTSLGTSQGQRTLVVLLGCAILGMVLSRILPFLIGKVQPKMSAVEAEEIGVLVALGTSGIVLVVSLLRPRRSVSLSRKQLVKEQEKSDGNP